MEHLSAKNFTRASSYCEIIVKHCPLVIVVWYKCMQAKLKFYLQAKNNCWNEFQKCQFQHLDHHTVLDGE